MRTVYWEDQKVKTSTSACRRASLVIAEFDTVEGIRAASVRCTWRACHMVAAYGMALAAYNSPAWDRDGLLNDLRAAKKTLDAARPTAVNLAWATARLMSMAEHTVLPNVDDIRSALLAEAEALADEDVEINRRMGYHGAEVVPDGSNILHHCNTGALATVDFGTALGVVYACQEQGKRIHVWVDETRPRLQARD